MENNNCKLNVLTITMSEKIRLISLIEKSDRKKCNIPLNTLSSIMKQKDKISMFINENMKKIRTILSYLDIKKMFVKTRCQNKKLPVSETILFEKGICTTTRIN